MAKIAYICSECSSTFAKWQGKCPSCGNWNTVVETTPIDKKSKVTKADIHITSLSKVGIDKTTRMVSGISELDRSLGGGFVKGSVILIGGDPGIGKSTLLIQCCEKVEKQGAKVLYITGEESLLQVKLRASRLKLDCENIDVMSENDVLTCVEAFNGYDFVVVDSIQTMNYEKASSAMGSVTQIRECASLIIHKAKALGVCVVLVGHVTKEGNIAGPKVLEHMVDAVLYFEGDRQQILRILRTQKNRFGSTNEVGVFEMTQLGLMEVTNPSVSFLGESKEKEAGCARVCTMEGTRPILLEVQSLLTKTVYGQPRRMAIGVDYNRLILLLAVLEKKLRIFTGNMDCYLNVVGGIDIDTPDIDLGVIMAVVSSIRDLPLDNDVVFIGEVGLTGEIRYVPSVQKRINECKKMGFTKIVVPYSCKKNVQDKEGVVFCSSLAQVFKNAFKG